MKRVEVKAWCDNHEPGQEEIPAVVERVVILAPKHRILLDLCEPCDKEVTGFLEHVEEIGQRIPEGKGRQSKPKPPAQAAALVQPAPAASQAETPPAIKGQHRRRNNDVSDGKPEGMRTCPECGGVWNTRSAMGQHLSKKHDAKMTDYDWPKG